RIRGMVREGALPQAGVEVVLADSTGKVGKMKTKTDAGGAYAFENVPPGAYLVMSAKVVSTLRKGSAPVAVEAGKTAVVDVALRL
ncbi:MAG: carboxypeptidase regulatory-like domain-containing protein, partial [Planctomycetia bacterium]